MMKSSLSVLTLGLLAFINQVVCDYKPVFPKCDCKIIEKIEHIWKLIGTPENTTVKFEKIYTLVATSFDYEGNPKCVYVNTTIDKCNSNVTTDIIYVPSCGCPQTSVYKFKEEGGTITALNAKTVLYVFYADNGVIINYLCDTGNDCDGPPAVNILVENDSWKKNCTQNTLKATEAISYLLGFKIIKTWGDECFSSGCSR